MPDIDYHNDSLEYILHDCLEINRLLTKINQQTTYLSDGRGEIVFQTETIGSALAAIKEICDRHYTKQLECPMCGAANAFTIDLQDPAKGFCSVEQTTWVIKPGRNAHLFGKAEAS